MIHYAVYIVSTGEIAYTTASNIEEGKFRQAFPAPAGTGLLTLDGPLPLPQTEYLVQANQLLPRPAMTPVVSKTVIAADGADECIITGLPSLFDVSITGAFTAEATDVTGGELTIVSTEPGEILVTVTAVPFKAWSIKINAV